MKKTIGLVMMIVFWLAALASAGALFYAEVLTKKYPYQRILEETNALPKAHQEWYMVTALIGATLLFASLAYLMYVKYMEKPVGQERVILGLKSEEG